MGSSEAFAACNLAANLAGSQTVFRGVVGKDSIVIHGMAFKKLVDCARNL